MNKIRRAMQSKAARWMGIAMIVAVVLMAGSILLPHFFGWRTDTVLSGSMSPTLRLGDLMVTEPVAADAIKVGDIITYRSPIDGSLVAHRVVEIQSQSELAFRTKGDANDRPDPYLVTSQNVVGVVKFSVPLLGYPVQFIKTPLGFALVLGIPGAAIISMEMKNIWAMLSEDEKQKR
jgi:signal peptidase